MVKPVLVSCQAQALKPNNSGGISTAIAFKRRQIGTLGSPHFTRSPLVKPSVTLSNAQCHEKQICSFCKCSPASPDGSSSACSNFPSFWKPQYSQFATCHIWEDIQTMHLGTQILTKDQGWECGKVWCRIQHSMVQHHYCIKMGTTEITTLRDHSSCPHVSKYLIQLNIGVKGRLKMRSNQTL